MCCKRQFERKRAGLHLVRDARGRRCHRGILRMWRRRPYDQQVYGTVNRLSSTGYSNWNGFQAELERRYSNGVGFQIFYVTGNTGTGSTPPTTQSGRLKRSFRERFHQISTQGTGSSTISVTSIRRNTRFDGTGLLTSRSARARLSAEKCRVSRQDRRRLADRRNGKLENQPRDIADQYSPPTADRDLREK